MAHLQPKDDLAQMRRSMSFTFPSTATDPEPLVVKYQGPVLNFLQEMTLREIAEKPDPNDPEKKRTFWSSTTAIFRLPYIILTYTDPGDPIESTSWNVEVPKNPFEPNPAALEWMTLDRTDENINKHILPTNLYAFGEKLWADVQASLGITDDRIVENLTAPLAPTTTDPSAAPVVEPSMPTTQATLSESSDVTSLSSDLSSPTNSEESTSPTADA